MIAGFNSGGKQFHRVLFNMAFCLCFSSLMQTLSALENYVCFLVKISIITNT